MPAKRYPLPKRFSAALSEEAYENLRKLNERYHLSNNYLLTVLLENIEVVADEAALDRAFTDFTTEFGAPQPGGMKK